MTATIDLSGLTRVRKRVRAVAQAYSDPARVSKLMTRLEKVIVEDNRRGVMLGQDKDGKPMPAVTYRNGRSRKNFAARKAGFGKNATGPIGHGPHAVGLNNNLTAAEYRRLTGPSLAPRRLRSRVVTNLVTRHYKASTGGWYAEGAWADVVSAKGVPFLHAHFTGAKVGRGKRVKLPVRDLRGVRPWGRERARQEARAFAAEVMRSS